MNARCNRSVFERYDTRRLCHAVIAALAFAAMLAGCVRNSVEALEPGASAGPEEAILIYGVVVDGTWETPMLAVDLDRYDLRTQAGAGGCFRHDQTKALVPAIRGYRRDFAFRVPPGHYTPSPFLAYSRQPDTHAFAAPAGRVVYAGTFVYSGNGRAQSRLELRHDFDAARHRLSSSFPRLANRLSPAATTVVTPARPFLCTP